MRFRGKSFVLLFCSLLVFSPHFYSQDMKDQLYLVREEVARVNMWDKYESTSKQWVEMMTEGGLDISYIRASMREDGHYYYLMPITSFSDIDKLAGVFGSAVEKAGKDEWLSFMAENESAIETHRDFVVRWSAEYSYVPKEPRIKMEEAKFSHWLFFKFRLEKRKELFEILKEWKKLYEDKNISSGFNIWTVELGLENDLVILTEYFKDGADFYKTIEEISPAMKEQENALWARMAPLLTKIDQKYGSLRPDLSYYKK